MKCMLGSWTYPEPTLCANHVIRRVRHYLPIARAFLLAEWFALPKLDFFQSEVIFVENSRSIFAHFLMILKLFNIVISRGECFLSNVKWFGGNIHWNAFVAHSLNIQMSLWPVVFSVSTVTKWKRKYFWWQDWKQEIQSSLNLRQS